MGDETTVRGVPLDLDGTLVDSDDAHDRVRVGALDEAGCRVPYGRVRELIVMGADNLLPTAIGLTRDAPDGKRIADRDDATFEREQLLPHRESISVEGGDGLPRNKRGGRP